MKPFVTVNTPECLVAVGTCIIFRRNQAPATYSPVLSSWDCLFGVASRPATSSELISVVISGWTGLSRPSLLILCFVPSFVSYVPIAFYSIPNSMSRFPPGVPFAPVDESCLQILASVIRVSFLICPHWELNCAAPATRLITICFPVCFPFRAILSLDPVYCFFRVCLFMSGSSACPVLGFGS